MKKIRSGGGITSNKLNARPMPKTSSPSQAMSPTAISRLGSKIGNHADTGKVNVPVVPLVRGAVPSVPLGNSVATNVGAGGPGKGRTTLPSGGQGKH
jgi:hypothetical protein